MQFLRHGRSFQDKSSKEVRRQNGNRNRAFLDYTEPQTRVVRVIRSVQNLAKKVYSKDLVASDHNLYTFGPFQYEGKI